MYSASLEKIFKKMNIETGDLVKIENKNGTFEGTLMPRSYESDIIVLKLANGYNIGIDSKSMNISLTKKSERVIKIEEKEVEIKGAISILGCGGTISSRVEYRTGAVYPVINPSELKMAFPQLERIAPINAKQLFSLLSEDMNSKHWKIIAKTVEEEIKDEAQGVVLMHGTDTMAYTAAAISFMLQNLPVPIIFVGAQRSADRPSSENEMNLVNAVYAATKDIAEVSVCMHASTNDDFCYLHRGVRVRKIHTSRRDAFKSVNSDPLAIIDYKNNRFEIVIEHRKRDQSNDQRFGVMNIDMRINENVALVYIHPNMKPKFIEKMRNYDGIVLIGTGLGHISTNPFADKNAKPIINEIEQLIKSGIPVVMSSQTIFGRINLDVYTAGRLLHEIGIIGHGADWTPETAFVKLSWVLGHEKKMKKVSDEMMTNMVGEISKRTPLNSFL